MNFNTVILYDIENLIGGYGNKEMLSKLSLKDIHKEILKKDIGGIAIQRAYANWSNPKLNSLRKDIVELGIDPIQMFGFGKGFQKNASDIQLAIDAMDIVFNKNIVEIFIIVSGDGGFSSLAKKLHEYGKTVIGCSFSGNASKVFATICDDFIRLEDPIKDFNTTKISLNGVTDPILIEFVRLFEPIEIDSDNIKEHTNEILEFFKSNVDSYYLLKSEGLNISILSQALSYRFINFNYKHLGFVKFTEFIRYITYGTDIKLVCKQPSDYRLLFKDSHINGFEDVEPVKEIAEIHTVDNYKILLGRGRPTFPLSNTYVLKNIIKFLSENKWDYQELFLEDINKRLDNFFYYNQKDIKNSVFILISAGCFKSDTEELPFNERRYSFAFDSLEVIFETIKKEMHNKLEEQLGYVKEDVFEELLCL